MAVFVATVFKDTQYQKKNAIQVWTNVIILLITEAAIPPGCLRAIAGSADSFAGLAV